MSDWIRPAFGAGIASTRLYERIVRSAVGSGFMGRQDLGDACASLWIDGELVRLEDLVLHDSTRDIRTPTPEPTIARDVLHTRGRIAGQLADWARSADGIRSLRKTSEIGSVGGDEATAADAIRPAVANDPQGEGKTPTAPKTCPALTTPPSTRSSLVRWRLSSRQESPARLRSIR